MSQLQTRIELEIKSMEKELESHLSRVAALEITILRMKNVLRGDRETKEIRPSKPRSSIKIEQTKRILEVLGRAKQPLKYMQIANLANVPQGSMTKVLAILTHEKRIKSEGTHFDRVWSLT